MNQPMHDDEELPLYELDDETMYSLEIAARLSGLNEESILRFQKQGFLHLTSGNQFDNEALRVLRHIEFLQSTCGVNDSGLRLILSLLEELEDLKILLRSKH
jgi:MerR family transcriptional regulator/heat shock protein HspR